MSDGNLSETSYRSQLTRCVLQSPTFLAPIAAAGIAAGKRIPQEISNQGILVLGDTLPDPTTPVFHPGDGSYFQRVYQ